MSSDEEFEKIHLSEQDVADIIDWAVGTAASLFMLKDYPQTNIWKLEAERLMHYTNGVKMMVDYMPECIVGLAVQTARESIEIEDTVAEFAEEIEKNL